MKYWQPIIRFLLKLFLIGSSQLFYVPSVCAQDSSSLPEEDREKHAPFATLAGISDGTLGDGGFRTDCLGGL